MFEQGQQAIWHQKIYEFRAFHCFKFFHKELLLYLKKKLKKSVILSKVNG